MNPLQALKERGGVDETFINQAERIVSETGRTYESAFIELKIEQRRCSRLYGGVLPGAGFCGTGGF